MFLSLKRFLSDIRLLSSYRLRIGTLATDGKEESAVAEEITELRSSRRQALVRLSVQLVLTAVVLLVAISILREEAASEAATDIANTMVGFVLGFWFR